MSELDLSPTSLQAEEDGKGLVSTAVSSLGNGWESPSPRRDKIERGCGGMGVGGRGGDNFPRASDAQADV